MNRLFKTVKFLFLYSWFRDIRKMPIVVDFNFQKKRSMLQDDEKFVGSNQVVEQEVAIEEDNAPSQGYPLSLIERRETT